MQCDIFKSLIWSSTNLNFPSYSEIQDTKYKMILLSFHVYNYTHIRHARYLDTKQYLTI